MSLPDRPSHVPALHVHARRLVTLLDIALSEVVRCMERSDQVAFTQWRATVVDLASQLGVSVTRDEIQWLWAIMKHEPRLREGPSTFVDDHLLKRVVLPEGSRFVIRLGDKAKLLAEDSQPIVALLGPLFMGDRKRGRAECHDVSAELRMRVRPRPLDDEAAAMGIEDKARLRYEEGTLFVRVDSLNEAYTKASMRLETWRRSHGGRVYDYLYWLRPPSEPLSLGYIREQVEEGQWKLPVRP